MRHYDLVNDWRMSAMPERLVRYFLAAFLAMAGAAGAAAQDQRLSLRVTSLSPAAIPNNLAEGHAASAPIGYTRFCAEHGHECAPSGPLTAMVRLDARRRAELERANTSVNASIEPATDLDHYGETERWTYPDDGRGDCEDYVLEKRRLLLNLGWPASVLLITVVRDQNGDGHAVLTVVSDHGDLVLDNQEEKILPWSETGYRYVKRQSQAHPARWVSLGDTGVPPVVGGGR
jgi:predicted transglutaminase-like cysteine proteinase